MATCEPRLTTDTVESPAERSARRDDPIEAFRPADGTGDAKTARAVAAALREREVTAAATAGPDVRRM